MEVTIYHNAECGTSRNALLAIRAAGHDDGKTVAALCRPSERVKLLLQGAS